MTFDTSLAILLAVPLRDHLSLAAVKNRLSEVVDKVEREHGRIEQPSRDQALARIRER